METQPLNDSNNHQIYCEPNTAEITLNQSQIPQDNAIKSEHLIPHETSFTIRKRDEELHKKILLYFSIIYLILFLTLLAIFSMNSSFRKWYLDLIFEVQEKSFQAYVTVFFIGILCLILGIPIFILEMVIGYIVKPLIYGILLIVAFKMTGLSITFLMGRYLLRKKLKTLIRDNEYLDAFQDHLDEEPFKIIFFLRVITIFPPILQDYGMGLLKIQYKHFFFPVLLSIVIFAFFYAYLGKSLKNMYEYYNEPDKNTQSNRDILINLVFLVLTFVVIGYFVQQVQKRLEVAKDESVRSMSQITTQRRLSIHEISNREIM